jgi:hypothetical protein
MSGICEYCLGKYTRIEGYDYDFVCTLMVEANNAGIIVVNCAHHKWMCPFLTSDNECGASSPGNLPKCKYCPSVVR